jgi:crotonobetaine/carnitine-CoA ligase
LNVRDLLERRVTEDPEKAFCWFQNQPLDFATLDRNVNRSANVLREYGVRKGDRVGLFLGNCPEFLYLWFALAKIGAVMVTADLNFNKEKLGYVLRHCDANVVVLGEDLFFYHVFEERDFSVVKNRIWHGGKAALPDSFHCLSDLMERANEEAPERVQVDDQDLLGIRYTADCKGRPKGVMVSHRCYAHSAQVLADEVIGCATEDVFLVILPLSQAKVHSLIPLCSLYTGRPLVLEEKFVPSRFLDLIRHYGVTVFIGTDRMMDVLMRLPEQDRDFDNPLRLAFGEGVSQSQETWKRLRQRFNVKVVEGYGLAETVGFCLCNRLHNAKTGSVGRPSDGYDATVWDANNQEIPLGDVGEIVVRHRETCSMFSGYYKQSDRTAEAWDGGWFHTGDEGYKDEDGYFYLVNGEVEGKK